MKREVERRYIPVSDLKVERRSDDGGTPKISGYAAVFGKLSENLGGFREKISRGAFTKALKSSDPRALFNHDSNYVLGRKSAGTLTLSEDNKGLFMEIDPPDTQFARDLMVSIERGDITQQSFGFYLASDGDKWDENKETGEVTRTITEVEELLDVSPVTYPAYPDTTVALRSLDKFKVTGDEETDKSLSITEGDLIVAFDDMEQLKRFNGKINEVINAAIREENEGDPSDKSEPINFDEALTRLENLQKRASSL